MKKMFFAVASVIAAVGMSTTAVSAQDFSPVGTGYTVSGNLVVRQTLPFDLACPLTPLSASVLASGNAVTTATVPGPLCSSGLGTGVTRTSNWTVTPTSLTTVTISNININALGGTCSGSVNGTISGSVITIPRQSIPGSPVVCWLQGTATISPAVTIVP